MIRLSTHRSSGRQIIVVLLLTLVSGGCAITAPHGPGRSLLPSRFRTTIGAYRIWTNGPVQAEDPAIHELLALERQVGRQLGMRTDPGQPPIDIYILDDRAAFEHFLKFYYPELPTRRAFFLARGNQRVVYAYRGDRLIEDLRHEVAHALMNGSAPGLPLWLDEGLAEYFEVPEDHRGLNAEHIKRLPRDLAEGWRPDLIRLEAIRDVREMTPRDYRESWAWAHYLLDGPAPGRSALLGYLADLKTTSSAAPLSARLGTGERLMNDRVVAHLELLQARPIAVAPTTNTAKVVVRGQDPSTELIQVPAIPERRRGMFGRLLDAVGFGTR